MQTTVRKKARGFWCIGGTAEIWSRWAGDGMAREHLVGVKNCVESEEEHSRGVWAMPSVAGSGTDMQPVAGLYTAYRIAACWKG